MSAVRWCRRVRERTQDIEDGAHAEGGPNRRDLLHGRMEHLRKQEAEIGVREAIRSTLRIGRQPNAERLQNIRAAGLAGNRTIAMFDDRHTAGSSQQRGAG